MENTCDNNKVGESICNHEDKAYLDQLLNFVDFKENVCYVTEKVSEIRKEIWTDVEIGYSVNECETLLDRQDQLELKCADTYSTFSILRQQADEMSDVKNVLWKHYRKSCRFMEDVCYSLASEIVSRRSLITSSAKFHSFLFQFRSDIEDVKIFIKAFEEVENLDIDMDFILKKIRMFIDQICNLAGAVVSQGVQLFDIISKLKISNKVKEIHRQHIGGWIAFAEVEREFRLKKLDQLVLRIQLLWQLRRCKTGINQSIEWLQELITAIISRSNEVGESAAEADALFLQLIHYKDTAQKSYEIGQKLLHSEGELKQKLNCDHSGVDLCLQLENKWKDFSSVFCQIAERLDLSQNFYRSIEKQMQKTKELETVLQAKLKLFGEVRRSFVIHRYKKSWTRIQAEIQKSLQTGRYLLDVLNRPVSPNHKVNLLSSSAAIKIVQTMSNAEKAAQQVQGSYFHDDPSTTEEYVSARSPDTWRSTSISGLEDWCSVGSGTTLDDFKSIEDDLAEEYHSEDSVEDLPLLSQPVTVPQEKKKDNGKREYAAVVGVREPKGHKLSANIQPGVSILPTNTSGGGTFASTRTDASTAKPQAKSGDDTRDRDVTVVSPKQAMSFEPHKYSSVITKTESKDVKTEVKTSYAMQTRIKAGGIDQTFTSHKSEDIQLKETTAPESAVEKIHKIVVTDEPRREIHKKPQSSDFPPKLTAASESKAKLLSELEGMKSKYFKATPDASRPTAPTASESKSENVSYGYSAYPSSAKGGDGRTTDVSRVVYSKEVTESQSMTSISFQQQSFGANRMEKWQSVTPQVKALPPVSESKETIESTLIDEKFKKLEQDIKEWLYARNDGSKKDK